MKKRYPYAIFLAALVLLGFGLIVLMSASSVYSIHSRESIFAIFYSQLKAGVVGILAMLFFLGYSHKKLKDYSKYLLILMVGILIVTRLFMPEVNHVHRWFKMPGFGFQPAEFAKLILFVHLAKLISDKHEHIQKLREGFILPLVWAVIVGGLIMSQPSFSNAMIIFIVSYLMLYLAGAHWKHLVSTVAIGIIPISLASALVPYVHARVEKFFGGIFTGDNLAPQVNQAIIALGSGGLMGRGIGNSWQRNLHLPEAYGDFIFSISGEELGFIGSVFIIAAFFAIFFIGLMIAKNAKNLYSQLLAFAISASFLLHAMIHIAVSVGFMPPTGIPLPFISNGGSSLVAISASLGILMNIGVTGQEEEPVQSEDGEVKDVEPEAKEAIA